MESRHAGPQVDRPAIATVRLPKPVAWQYTTLPHKGACKMDGAKISIRLRLRSLCLRECPDVLAVETWLARLLTEPVVVEEVALAARARWGMEATVVGETATHGPLRVTA